MNKLVKDALVLTAITLISGAALGAVYEITKAPIAAAEEQATQDAYREVFESAASFGDYEGFDAVAASDAVHAAGFEDDDIDNCVLALDDAGNTLGMVVTVTSHAGYGGDITLSIGVTNEGVMNGYSITSISETAGLGMKAKEANFMDQFKNIAISTLEVVKTSPESENQIEAISGATITSKAVTNAVNAGFAYVNTIVTGGATNE